MLVECRHAKLQTSVDRHSCHMLRILTKIAMSCKCVFHRMFDHPADKLSYRSENSEINSQQLNKSRSSVAITVAARWSETRDKTPSICTFDYRVTSNETIFLYFSTKSIPKIHRWKRKKNTYFINFSYSILNYGPLGKEE